MKNRVTDLPTEPFLGQESMKLFVLPEKRLEFMPSKS